VRDRGMHRGEGLPAAAWRHSWPQPPVVNDGTRRADDVCVAVCMYAALKRMYCNSDREPYQILGSVFGCKLAKCVSQCVRSAKNGFNCSLKVWRRLVPSHFIENPTLSQGRMPKTYFRADPNAGGPGRLTGRTGGARQELGPRRRWPTVQGASTGACARARGPRCAAGAAVHCASACAGVFRAARRRLRRPARRPPGRARKHTCRCAWMAGEPHAPGAVAWAVGRMGTIGARRVEVEARRLAGPGRRRARAPVRAGAPAAELIYL
jgi:hypothetical protein